MNKKEEFKKLRKEIFLFRKAKELSLGFAIILTTIFFPYYLGKFILTLSFTTPEFLKMIGIYSLTSFDVWGLGLMCSMVLFLIGLIIYLLFFGIQVWIKSNWEHATEEAEDIIRKRRKTKNE